MGCVSSQPDKKTLPKNQHEAYKQTYQQNQAAAVDPQIHSNNVMHGTNHSPQIGSELKNMHQVKQKITNPNQLDPNHLHIDGHQFENVKQSSIQIQYPQLNDAEPRGNHQGENKQKLVSDIPASTFPHGQIKEHQVPSDSLNGAEKVIHKSRFSTQHEESVVLDEGVSNFSTPFNLPNGHQLT